MLDHLDYIVERIGVDHVGIGTDFNHGSAVKGFRSAVNEADKEPEQIGDKSEDASFENTPEEHREEKQA